MSEGQVSVVLVSGPDAETLEGLGRTLVEERLAACVNVIPGLTSVYRWEGEVRTDAEALALVKTTRPGVEAVCRRVAELHPYDLAECVALDVSRGSPGYVRWIRESVEARLANGEA